MVSLLKTLMIFTYASLISIIIAPLAMIFEPLHELVTDEKSYFIVLTMALSIDLVVGCMKYIKLHQFSFKELVIGLIVKIVVSYGGFMLFYAFASLEEGWAAEWFTLVAKFTVLLYPAGSAISSMYILTDGKFPPLSFMKRLKTFDDVISPVIQTSEIDEDAN